MSVDPDRFRSVLSRFASGVTVVSALDADGADHGMTVSAFSSVSLTPPLVLACIDHAASMHGVLTSAEFFGISILSLEHEPLARHFADAAVDRWAGVRSVRGTTGVALVEGALAHLECRVDSRHDAGDHMIVIGEVIEGTVAAGPPPLIYFRGGYAELVR